MPAMLGVTISIIIVAHFADSDFGAGTHKGTPTGNHFADANVRQHQR
jgi:hypothetical protein